jgi:uncharacterized protein
MADKKSIVRLGIIVILVLVVVALLGASWVFSSMLIHPGYKCDPDHYVYCGDPSEQKIRFENVSFTTRDGVTLNGWFMPSVVPGTRAIVMVHGHGGGRHEGMRYAKMLTEAGFSLLAFDLRVFSASDKAFSSMGYYEKLDVIAAVDFMVKAKKISSVGVFGTSLGASTAVLAMAEDTRIKSGLFNSGYSNVADVLAQVGKRDYGLPRFPLIPLVMRLAGLRTGADMDAINAEDKIGSIAPRPVFIMHCTADDFVPYSHGERMFKAAKEPKEMWSPECTRHVREWNQFRTESERHVREFFQRTL